MDTNKNRNVSSILIRSVLYLFFISLFLLTLLHLPYVQNRIINAILQPLTASINGTIHIGGTQANIYQGVSLNNVILVAPEGDTLLQVNTVRISPRNTLLTLISGELALHDVLLDGISLRVHMPKDGGPSNWQRFIGEQKKDPDETKSRTTPELSFLRLTNVHLDWVDDWNNEKVNARFLALEVDINSLSLTDTTRIDISRLLLDSPEITYISGPGVKSDDPTDLSDSVEVNPDSLGKKNLFPSIKIADFTIVHGALHVQREEEDFEASHLDLSISNLEISEANQWTMRINNISGETGNDLLPYASIGNIRRVEDEMLLSDAVININNSRIRFSGQFGNIEGIADVSSPEINLSLKPSFLYLKDLYTLIPSLKKQLDKTPIAQERIQLEGDFSLIENRYRAEQISVWLNGQHHFAGNLSFDKAENINESALNVTIDQLYADVADLSRMVPQIDISEELIRLKSIDFTGSFDGYLNDFVANGLLISPLGIANMDIKFDLSGKDQESISYDGFLSLDSFDLRAFTLNDDFGIIAANVNISDGQGVDLSSSSANLKAVIDKFEYKDFVYEGAVYEGQLSSKIIDGKFEIHDEELDFEFEGVVNFTDSLPVFNFKVLADKINFCQLNITQFPCNLAFSSDINLKGSNLNNIDGNAIINNIRLRHDTASLDIEKIEILSIPGTIANSFSFKSDYVDLFVEGRFNLLEVYQNSLDQLVVNAEEHQDVLDYDLSSDSTIYQDYVYSILLKDATDVFKFLNLNIEQEGLASITGSHNSHKDQLAMKALIPYLAYNDIGANNIEIDLNSADRRTTLNTQLEDISRSNYQLQSLNIGAELKKEFIDWNFEFNYDAFNTSNLVGRSRVQDGGYFTEFIDEDVLLDSTRWKILSKEGIGIYPGMIDIPEFTLSDGERYITLKDIDNKGLEIAINDFALDFINPIIDYDKTVLTGSIKSQIRIDDLYDDLVLQGFLDVADFKINGDDFGHLLLKGQRSLDNKNVIDINLSIEKDTQNLYAVGYINLETSYLNVDVNLEDYPMNFFEYIIEEGISETTGTTDIRAKVYGSMDDLTLSGTGLIKNAGVKVDYLGAYYRMEDQRVNIDTRFIDFNNVELIDEMGNTAVITGGLRHNLLADIRADLQISSDRFIGLNTTDLDNPLYYGLGVGKIDISFKGPFDAIDIVVNARLDNLSRLSIPLTTTSYIFDESFIVFTNEKDTTIEDDSESLAELLKEQGVDFEMSLTFTPDAVVSIIYDETTGNILEGTGEGNIQINVKRDGEFTAYGNYNILSGKYLYTAYGLIAKQFVIRNGGSVIWTGDPLNATLDVTAEYPQLRAPLRNFLSEYQGTPGVTDQALSIRRDVDLTLILTGPLFNPNINFDISFPDLTGNLRTYAQNKVRVLRSTENGINNQVVGLLIFRDFLPDNNGLAAISQSDVGQTGTNTITQFLTSQLSLLFSDYLSSKLGDNNILSGIDFEIAVAQNSILSEDANLFEGLIDVVPDEFQLNLRNRFKNENFVLNLGGNYVRENQLSQAQNYVTGDFSLDWYITEDKRLKLRFYGNYDYDDAFSTRRQRYGFGINYRKEFGSLTFTGFQQVLENMIREIQAESTSTDGID